MSKDNNKLCSLLWKHVCIRPNYTLSPCCRYESKKTDFGRLQKDGTINYNSEAYRNIRKDMLNNINLEGCQQCHSEEKITGESTRMFSNKKYGFPENLNSEGSLSDVEYLEVFVGSVCNLKCLTCSPTLSTSIHADYKKLGWLKEGQKTFTIPNELNFIQEMTRLKHIKFVGGEPFLNPYHDSILKSLNNSSTNDLSLTYYTNCTVWPTDETLEFWESFNNISINISIDGIGEKNDYLRKNSDWEKVEALAHKYYSLAAKKSNITLQASTTVSLFNIFYLKEIDDWFDKLADSYPQANTEPAYMTYVTDPEHLSPHSAPASLIQSLLSKERNNLSQQHLKILSELEQAGSRGSLFDRKHFFSFIGPLEKLRKNSFLEVFPEIADHFK